MSLEIVRSVAALRARVAGWRKEGIRVGVVPTMGALHEGHMSLVRLAQSHADRVIVTLFVNPTQFNNKDDLAAYPRTEHEDAAKLAALDVDILYAPDAAEMYPNGFSTTVSVKGVSEGLCGAFRPGHFDGVATVVTKLLLQSGADCAVFGEKDFQQLSVIRRLVADLDIPVEIIPGPTVRETDGLAMSSRNVRLTPDGRAAAPALAAALFEAATKLRTGAPIAPTIAATRDAILAAGFTEVEYLELRDAISLAPVDALTGPARLLVAAWRDGVRLIDNVQVDRP
ncbi:pantoate--beta-alanine ligase [Pelagibacterium limicola]|uniref:pantoate--beta-alanine ligase n=1 Tax=Pelagibacterium limicola TaxID=2791022 RepID=UPI0018AF9150|nr:pantoate--beta-alanine ligase [Pelagibacterium limicola]